MMDVDMGASGRASLGANSHEEKFRVYNEALVHAASCADAQCQAHSGRCHKVKASIDHFVRCYGPRRRVSPIERCPSLYTIYGLAVDVALTLLSVCVRMGSCESCSKIWGLLCFHAKTCATPSGMRCAVSQCDYLRDKIARKRESDKRELEEAKSKMKQKLEEWPVERRIAQVEADRQQVMQLIADLRARKAQQQQQQQQLFASPHQRPMMSMS